MDVKSFFPFPNCEIFFSIPPPPQGGQIGKNILPCSINFIRYISQRASICSLHTKFQVKKNKNKNLIAKKSQRELKSSAPL